jgi:hypothetical protein
MLCADTVPPTASVAAESAFTSASNVSVLISLSEPCPGAGGFTCNATYCNVRRATLQTPFCT